MWSSKTKEMNKESSLEKISLNKKIFKAIPSDRIRNSLTKKLIKSRDNEKLKNPENYYSSFRRAITGELAKGSPDVAAFYIGTNALSTALSPATKGLSMIPGINSGGTIAYLTATRLPRIRRLMTDRDLISLGVDPKQRLIGRYKSLLIK